MKHVWENRMRISTLKVEEKLKLHSFLQEFTTKFHKNPCNSLNQTSKVREKLRELGPPSSLENGAPP